MIKRVFAFLCAAIALLTLATTQPVWADADIAVGAKVFAANCAACHANGMNVVMAPKNLKKESLEKFGMYSADAIITQVTNGKGAMPSFKSKLQPDQIASVAAYVLNKADAAWAK